MLATWLHWLWLAITTHYVGIINAIVAIFALGILAGMLYLCKLTHANGFIWKAAAFFWVAINRCLLLAHIMPFAQYSAQSALPFYILFAIGAWLTITKLLSVYRNGSSPVTDQVAASLVVTQAAEQAAETLKGTAAHTAEALKAHEGNGASK